MKGSGTVWIRIKEAQNIWILDPELDPEHCSK